MILHFLGIEFSVAGAQNACDSMTTKNFEAVLKDFHKAQWLVVERETAYAPSVAKSSHSLW